MRVLVVGGGGREHALVWSLSKSPLVTDLLCAPGNPGIAELARCCPVAAGDLPGMVAMATRESVDLVVVGPEAPLVAGLADALRLAGIRVFGPGAAGARLEGSKGWAKSLMAAAGIPTAASQSFERAGEAIAYARRLIAEGTGAVVKADGLAAGKGVTVCDDDAQAAAAITDALERRVFGAAGSRVLEPIAAALATGGEGYVGVIYAGIMLTPDGPKVLEFNCRFGDPETQALLPRLASDLMEPILACTDGTLSEVRLDWRPEACVAVVAAAAGYPGNPSTGAPISGLAGAEAVTGVPVFHAGTRPGPDGSVVTSGGRVLAVAALGDTAWLARRRAYDGLARVSFDGMWYRSDIGPRPASRPESEPNGSPNLEPELEQGTWTGGVA